MDHLESARAVFHAEINGIIEVESKIGEEFDKVINHVASSTGRVVMCGMGKSGHIAKKIFATFVSTGTPSLFMHPAEAYHGDLGMIKSEDIFFAISNSGETSEVTQLLPFIKANGNTLISMTGNNSSTIAKASDYHLNIGVTTEACPLNLAPTASTTASLVLGDAIAISLMKAKDFKAENFARYHPGGSLGRMLLGTVRDSMHEAFFIEPTASFVDVISYLSKSKCGVVLVGTKENLKGIITDGDIRKFLIANPDVSNKHIAARELMTSSPTTISAASRYSDATKKMKESTVNSLVVVENNKVVGIYDNLNRK